ncbi:ATP-binding protein [Amycolatopsis palatopharyngis]|uniref:ATP-binding protein n=1 Tax=Amycolatopsis palatopharyngis TaxID=187982 RepID=UPI0013BE9A2D|nr:ATP-binding protein [Amycolatopsis palatopharyngis]
MSQPGVVDDLGIDNFVELRIPADAVQLAVPRTVAETIALRRDLDLDTVADIKLATDEACATLIAAAVAHSTLTCRFEVYADSLTVSVSTTVVREGVPAQGNLGWFVLEMLADSVNATQIAYDPVMAGYSTMIEFTRSGNRVPA